MAGVQRWALVACGVAWLSGMALAALLPVSSLGVPLLLAGSIFLAGAITLAVIIARGAAGRAGLSALAGCGLLALALLGMARFVFAAPGNDPHSITRLSYGTKLDVRGTVVGEPDVRAKGAFLAVAVQSATPTQQNTWRAVDGTVQVYALGLPGAFAPEYGDTVLFTGVLSAPTRTPPGIDADLGAARVDVLAHGGGNPILGAIYQLRAALANALQRALPAPEAALIIGILLGLKTPVLRARLPLFVRTGTIHLVVTSGLKVTLVGDIAARLARPLGRWVSLIGSLAVVVGYVILSGAGPAAIRAGIMGALLILARFLGRDYDVLNALAVACLLMTAITPGVLWDAGFQLSATGTLGIVLLGPRLRQPLLARLAAGAWGASRRMCWHPPWRRNWPHCLSSPSPSASFHSFRC